MDFRTMALNIQKFVPDVSIIVIKQRINQRYQQIVKLREWEYLKDDTTTGTSWMISTGSSCRVAYGATQVISRDQSGCSFYSHHAGWWIRFGSEAQPYEVSAVTDTSRLTLTRPYSGTSVGITAGTSFELFKAVYTSAVSMAEIHSMVFEDELDEVSLNRLNRIDPERTDTGKPEKYAIVEQNKYRGRIKWQFWPITDSDGWTVRIYYKKLVTNLSNDADIPLCSPELLEAWALKDCYKIAAVKNPIYARLARDQSVEVKEILYDEIERDKETATLPTKVRDAMKGSYISDDYNLDHDTEPW